MPECGAEYILRDVLVPQVVAGGGAQARRNGAFLRGDLAISGQIATGLWPGEKTDTPRIVLPALVEAHCHLDKCHTIDRLRDVGGDLAHAIATQRADRMQWTEDDLRARAARGLDELQAAGCGLVRSHVDWGEDDQPPLAWHVLGDLARDRADAVTLELAPLTGIEQLADPDLALAIVRSVVRTGGRVLGSYLLDQPERAAGLRQAFALADRFGMALDFHVDEGLAGGAEGLTMIAEAAIETRFQGPVLCGHACSLMNLSGGALARLLDKLAAAGVAVAALPATNLYLQGRGPGTPDRRGVTRLREMHAAGVPVVVGSDNVADAFCPLGRHDPMAALHLAVLAAHLDPPLDRWLPAITAGAARALGHDPGAVLGAPVHRLRLSPARTLPELIAGSLPPPTRLSLHMEPWT